MTVLHRLSRLGWACLLPGLIVADALAGPVGPFDRPDASRTSHQDSDDVTDTEYLAGVEALQAGRLEDALAAFERVVLRQPDHAGAWIDLAITHQRLGDLDSAAAVLRHVETYFDPPPALRQQLSAALRDLRRSTREAGWQIDAGAQLGYVQNVNGGLSLGSISLTPGGITVPVELDRSQRARGDRAVQYRAGAYRMWRGGSGSSTEAFAALRSRQFDSEGDFDFTDVGAGLQHSRPITDRLSGFAGVNLRHLRLGNSALANFRSLQGGLRYRIGTCATTVRLEYESRGYVANGFVPAVIPWAGVALDCAPGWIDAGISLRSGLDDPEAQRAGSSTRRNELTAYVRRSLPAGWEAEATLFLAQNRDTSGFNPLLSNGARREVDRLGYRLTLSRPIGGQNGPWLMQVDYEEAFDNSNLELFRFEDRVLLVGFRYRIR